MPQSVTLAIDPAAAAAEIELALRTHVLSTLRRQGVVVGLSGGVDSWGAAALGARALGKPRVLGALRPAGASSAAPPGLGRLVAETLDTPFVVEDVTASLEAARCYDRQVDAIREVVPEYGLGW